MKDKELSNKWMVATSLQSLHIAESSMLCENHFKPENYNNPLDPKSRLKKGSIPSIFTCPPHLSASISTKRTPPTEPLAHAKKVKLECEHSVNHETVSEEEDLKEKLLTSRKKISTLQQNKTEGQKNQNIIGSYIGFKGEVINLCRCFKCN